MPTPSPPLNPPNSGPRPTCARSGCPALRTYRSAYCGQLCSVLTRVMRLVAGSGPAPRGRNRDADAVKVLRLCEYVDMTRVRRLDPTDFLWLLNTRRDYRDA